MADTPTVTPALPLRLLRLAVQRESLPGQLPAPGAGVRLLVDVLSSPALLDDLNRQVLTATTPIRAELQAAGAVANEDTVRLQRLREALAKAEEGVVTAEQAAVEAKSAARQALASGKSPDREEKKRSEALADFDRLQERKAALLPLIAAAQRHVEAQRSQAVGKRRQELRAAAVAEFRQVEKDALPMLAELLVALLVARAKVGASRPGPGDAGELAVELAAKQDAALRRTFVDIARRNPPESQAGQPKILPLPANDQSEIDILGLPRDEALPAGVRAI